MKENTIITIRYEIGTDGVAAAKKLAESYGIPYYDNEIMAEMMTQDANTDYFKNAGTTEKVDRTYGGINFFENVDGVRFKSRNNVMFEEQSKLTRKLAEQGSAVFVSRCADSVLEEDFDLVNVFIGADLENRVHYMMEHEKVDYKTAKGMVKEIERGRKTYYHYFVDKPWGLREDYDLCMDGGKLTADGMVEIIRAYIENRK